MEEGRLEEKKSKCLHHHWLHAPASYCTPWTSRYILPFNRNHRRQYYSVSISSKNDHLNTVSMSDCFRPWPPIHEQKPHASHVLMLTNVDHFPLLFLKIIVCYMERNAANRNCTLCYFISKVLSLPPLQSKLTERTKQQELTLPPYNNELSDCLFKRVTSHVLCCNPKH